MASLVATATVGCAHMIENRAIDRFAQSLQAENLDGLKSATSQRFSERALRTADSLRDIKILRLPDGKTTIVEVETLSEAHRRVTVQVGEAKKEVFYELVRDDQGKWVVDDVYLKQKKLGVTAYKSVTEQLDLLLTVREFLDAWQTGERERLLTISSANMRSELAELSPQYLSVLMKQVTGGKSLTERFKPQAQLDDASAVVTLGWTGGQTVLSLERTQEKWQVTDIAVDSKNEEDRIPSVLKLAIAVNACQNFLEAYAQDDKPRLQPLCDADFFAGSLGIGNLKQVLLPDAEFSGHKMKVQMQGPRADFLLTGDQEVVQINMRREDAAEPKAPPKFLVTDVTIYEMETQQEKRLSAIFTAQAMLELFCDALASRNLDHLRHTSTQDFANRVWRRLNSATIQGLPLEQFDNSEVTIDSMRFQGSLTRVDAHQGGQPVVYLLREESGRFYVDDLEWQVSGRPASVKRTLSLLVPMRNFGAAMVLGRDPAQQKMVLEMLRETCSTDFNRLVWEQTDFLPNSGLGADTFLNAPLRSIVESDTEVLIQLGTEEFGAVVKLRKERNRELVDDVTLIGGLEQADRVNFKQTMRTLLATGQAVRPAGNRQYAAKPEASPRKIQTAVYEEFEDEHPQEILRTSDVIDTQRRGSSPTAPLTAEPAKLPASPAVPRPLQIEADPFDN